jgi:hypothetical protein
LISLGRQHAPDAAHISVGHFSCHVQIALALTGLLGQKVTGHGLLSCYLARAALFETLLGTTVCLHFGHKKLLSHHGTGSHTKDANNLILSLRGDNYENVSPFVSGCGFNLADFLQISLYTSEQLPSHVAMRVLTTAKFDGDAHLVPLGQKLFGVTHFELVIVITDAHPHADLFELRAVLTAFFGLLALLILVFAIVHNSANRRASIGSDFNKIQFGGFRHFNCLGRFDNAKLFTFLID